MDFIDVVRKRRMVRNFTEAPVSPEAIDRILDLARRGPSAGFTQGQDFIVVTDPATKKVIAEICGEAEYTGFGFCSVCLWRAGADRAVYERGGLPPSLSRTGQDPGRWNRN